MTDWGKVIPITVIWIISGIISLAAAVNIRSMSFGESTVAAIILSPMVIAMFSTILIWEPEGLYDYKKRPKSSKSVFGAFSSKNKFTDDKEPNKFTLLMELMSEDEKLELIDEMKAAIRLQLFEEINRGSHNDDITIDDLLLLYDDKSKRHHH